MKKLFIFAIITLAIGAGSAFAHCGNCPGDKKAEVKKESAAPAKKDCGDCPMHKKQAAAKHGGKMCGGMTCPENIKGAVTDTKNVKGGVETTVTAKDPETVAQIQELAMVHYSPKAEKCAGCPTTVPGAKTSVKNIENGILVSITGADDATVKKIQAAAAKEHKGHKAAPGKGKPSAKAGKTYMCAMKCVESAKPGRCPKCGMTMEEVK